MKIDELKELGLTNHESQIYLSLVKLGESSAKDIIKITGYHRNIIYDNIERLIQKGLISFIYKDKKKYFRPTKANALIEMLDEKKNEILKQKEKVKKLIKEIEKLIKEKKPVLNASIYYGIIGVKEVLFQVLKEKKYFGIGISNASVDVLGELFWTNYIQKIKENKIKEYLLLNNDFNRNVPIHSPKKTYIRYLPEQTELITEILIYGKNVAIIVYTNPPIATVIENKEAVKSFISYFNTLWKRSKKNKLVTKKDYSNFSI